MWCTFIILVGVLVFFGYRFAKKHGVVDEVVTKIKKAKEQPPGK